MNTFRFWLVFSVGVAAGAAVALIYAPQAGAKTRKQLRRKIDSAQGYVQDQLDDAGEYIKDQASAVGEQATKAYKRGKDAASDASDDLMDNLQHAVKSVKSSVS